MLKEVIKYEDYNGDEREESFYFNLTEAEIAELELSTTGGLEQMVNRIVETRNGAEIISMFKKIILMSYGEKSLDGRRFVKSDELRQSFEQCPAFSILFMRLASDEAAATAFVNGIVPKESKNK